MGWFTSWWQGLGLLGQIMACAAIPMTVVLFLQAILMVVGLGLGSDSDGGADGDDADFDADTDSDFDADVDLDTDADLDVDAETDFDAEIVDSHESPHTQGSHSNGLKIFTVRGIVAFFAIGGWAGLAALKSGVPPAWTVQIALVAGVAAMLLASVVIRFALRMQSSGNLDLRNAVSHTAEVYITIPPSRLDTGRVTMLLQERFVELEAVTDSETALKPNTRVEVVGLAGGDCLVVRPAAEERG